MRAFRQLEQAGVAIEILLIVIFQQPGSRQLAIREPQKPAGPAQGQSQGKTPEDPIADVEAHKGEELGRRGVELVGRAVVTVPIEYEMGGENAAARHRGDVGHLGQNTRVAEKTDQAEMIQASRGSRLRTGPDRCFS